MTIIAFRDSRLIEVAINGTTNYANAQTVEESIFNELAVTLDEAIKKIENGEHGETIVDPDSIKPVKFSYTGQAQEYIAPVSGKYQIELWGAEGNYYASGNSYQNTGKGAYVSGEIYLNKGTKLYVYVGQHSHDSNSYSSSMFNGGTISTPAWVGHYSGSGGGATDIRLTGGNWDNFDSLKSRIMVAGAGGGNLYNHDNNWSKGSYAGGLQGGDFIWNSSFYAKGATQVSGGATAVTQWGTDSEDGKFGKGGNAARNGIAPIGGAGGSRILWRSWRKSFKWFMCCRRRRRIFLYFRAQWMRCDFR